MDKALLSQILRTVKAAFVDFDGVIADTEHLHALTYVRILEDHGIRFLPPDFSRYIGKPALAILSEMEETYGIQIDKSTVVAERTRHFMSLANEVGIQPNDYVRCIIQYLHRNQACVTVLSSQNGYVIDKMLRQWGMQAYFDRIITVPKDVPSKPHAFDAVEALLGAPPNETVVVEDSPLMLCEAKHRGMLTIGVRHRYNKEQRLMPDFLVEVQD